MKVGIVGLPNVGKSTLFNCLSQSKAQSENYPFCTIDPNIGVVEVKDERLDKLFNLSKSKNITSFFTPYFRRILIKWSFRNKIVYFKQFCFFILKNNIFKFFYERIVLIYYSCFL